MDDSGYYWTIHIVYHLTTYNAGTYSGIRYFILERERLHCDNPDPQPLPQLGLEQVRVVIMIGLKQQVVEYNPTLQPKDHKTIWLFGTAPIINLP